MVTFVLPAKADNDWVRTGRGFNAVRWYKEHKKGIGKMKTITIEVRDNADLDEFLKALLNNSSDLKVDPIFSLEHSLVKDGDRCNQLRLVKEKYQSDTSINLKLSNWLDEAEEDGHYPLASSKDEPDKEAIADARQAPKDTDNQGDVYMD